VGNTDTISLNLMDPQGALMFASNWNGTGVVEQVLGGGNVEVR
jgi:hypothetical protein